MKTKTKKAVPLSKLPRAQARVAIAEDVLASLRAKKLIAEAGTYLEVDWDDDGHWENSIDLARPVVDSLKTKQCMVCAVGAIFCSTVKKTNVIADKVVSHSAISDGWKALDFFNEGRARSYLHRYFTPKMLTAIEAAFEGTDYDGDAGADDGAATPATLKFYNRFETDDRRVKAIMKNIVRNEGTFVP